MADKMTTIPTAIYKLGITKPIQCRMAQIRLVRELVVLFAKGIPKVSDIKHSGAGHRRGAPWRLLCTLRVLRDSRLHQAVERLKLDI